jgi:tubulin polyglutamylase TTLL1/tubulin monoglycylase TTLL3/8
LQRYLDTLPANGRNLDLHQVILPQMRTIAATAIKSSWVSINPKRKDKNFELFGLDFMIDEHFKPWLIEVNTNPCL